MDILSYFRFLHFLEQRCHLILLTILYWKGDEDEKLVKVANVRKDNYNINIMENFPMDIEIGPQVRFYYIAHMTLTKQLG